MPSSESEKNSGNSSDSTNRSHCNTGLESINSFTFIGGETNGVPADSLSFKMKVSLIITFNSRVVSLVKNEANASNGFIELI